MFRTLRWFALLDLQSLLRTLSLSASEPWLMLSCIWATLGADGLAPGFSPGGRLRGAREKSSA